jgi:hypothetical protein
MLWHMAEEAAAEERKPFQYLSRKPSWQRRRKTGETKRMLALWHRQAYEAPMSSGLWIGVSRCSRRGALNR